MSETYFSILGLPFDATDAEIGEAHVQLKAQHKSDQAYLQRLDDAYWHLSNPITRKQYVRTLRAQGVVDQVAETSSQEQPPSHVPSSRKHTSPEGGGLADPPATAGSPTKRSARQRTEFLDASPSLDPGSHPSTESGRTDTGHGSHGMRQRTEFLDANPTSKPSVSPQAQGNIRQRQRTDFLDTPVVQSPPTPSEKEKGTPHVATPAVQTPPSTVGSAPASPRGATSADSSTPSPKATAGNKPLTPSPSSEVTVLRGEVGHDATVMHAIKTVVVEVSYRGDVKQYPLHSGANLIGRPPVQGEPPAIPLPDPEKYISRRHAVIVWNGQHCRLIDQGSRNGTYLNDQRLQPQQEFDLKSGDIIVIEERRLRISMS